MTRGDNRGNAWKCTRVNKLKRGRAKRTKGYVGKVDKLVLETSV